MKKNTLAKRVVILLVILMLDHIIQASSNSFYPNQGNRRELRTRISVPSPPKLRPSIHVRPPRTRYPPPRFIPCPPPPK
ncbi:hypothetical protein CTI12_AA048210 [Artemisia annua]|uniref:Transmembrane protein n=1 Tax=Artemisia annua TaxID=35608 RepID=A0A2U1QC73_ARTAN|nr:hypothetical protein CTI12_AA048210 [Artemisia annua]